MALYTNIRAKSKRAQLYPKGTPMRGEMTDRLKELLQKERKWQKNRSREGKQGDCPQWLSIQDNVRKVTRAASGTMKIFERKEQGRYLTRSPVRDPNRCFGGDGKGAKGKHQKASAHPAKETRQLATSFKWTNMGFCGKMESEILSQKSHFIFAHRCAPCNVRFFLCNSS